VTDTRVDRQRVARAKRARANRETAELATRELVRGGIWGVTEFRLALALLRSLPSRGNWRLTSFWAPGCQCRLCGRVLHDRHVRAAHLTSCARSFLDRWPIELAELLRRSYTAVEIAAIASFCESLAGGSRC